MRSLDQVAPRTPIPGGTTGFSINAPGSYYLTGNITVTTGNGISVNVDNVSIDLNGFTISSTANPANGFGVALVGGRSHVAVSNGHIRGTTTYSGSFTTGGFTSGVDYSGAPPKNVRVEALSVSGTGSYGVDLGTDRSTVITNSTARTCQFIGLRAGAVSDSAALEAGSTAISATTASNVLGTLTGAGTAVAVTDPTIASVSTQITSLQSSVTGSTDPRTRIPGGSNNFVISSSGSYVLTGNLTVADSDGIQINADNVTLDLNGYTITCTGGSSPGSGVLINGSRENVTVRNGNIVGGTTFSAGTYTTAGFFNGIFASSGARNVRIENVSVFGVQRGLQISLTDDSGIIENCHVNVSATSGLTAAIVHRSIARVCANNAITGKSVTGCVGESNGGYGISAENVSDSLGISSSSSSSFAGIFASTATNCTGTGTNAAAGLFSIVATNCRGTAVSGFGVNASQAATNCFGSSTSGTGVSTQIANQCNGISTSGTGLVATIGVACRGSGATPFSITNRYNMP